MRVQAISSGSSQVEQRALLTPELPLLDLSKLDMADGLVVVNRTKRFVFNVPNLVGSGEPLVAPDCTVLKTVPAVELSGSERVVMRQGSCWREKADGSYEDLPRVYPDKGVVFRNHTDNCWQAVRGNGQESIIFTDVTDQQARMMNLYLNNLQPAKLSSETIIQKLLSFADQIGLVDRQNEENRAD
jgi:hypothetical protein